MATVISFLSQGTTLERGTIVMTGTGPGVGAMRNPKVVLQSGDDMRVEVEGIGTLINEVVYEKTLCFRRRGGMRERGYVEYIDKRPGFPVTDNGYCVVDLCYYICV